MGKWRTIKENQIWFRFLRVSSENICKRVLCNKYPSIISNRQILIVRRENAFCKLHTFSGFVYHVSCLPCFETKIK